MWLLQTPPCVSWCPREGPGQPCRVASFRRTVLPLGFRVRRRVARAAPWGALELWLVPGVPVTSPARAPPSPVGQDGSCNGLQHYAALGRDSIGAASVNLLPSDFPQDVYSGVAAQVGATSPTSVRRAHWRLRPPTACVGGARGLFPPVMGPGGQGGLP